MWLQQQGRSLLFAINRRRFIVSLWSSPLVSVSTSQQQHSTSLGFPQIINSSTRNISNKSKTIDLSEPHLWYGKARDLKRQVICHVGVTNSGKTYNALTSLNAAKTGIYCGPLRLLAWEVAEKMKQKGIACSLRTGQEEQIDENGTHVSCTVEMADLSQVYDVAVVDECQMIGDETRGWAWTTAILGLQAKELHLCGSPSMLSIVQKLCALTKDTLTVRSYSRLTPLAVSNKPLKSFANVEKGDCIVGFGRRGLYETKRAIERSNPELRCCVIYGALPPDARRRQAELFSQEDSGYDVLVATDAIGMGLNLAIKRVIFAEVVKNDGRKRRHLMSHEIKQIAGRAGRYGTRHENGLVTALRSEDLTVVRKGLEVTDKAIKRAGLSPSLAQLELLGVLIDYKVNDQVMKAFWKDAYRREWGHDEHNPNGGGMAAAAAAGDWNGLANCNGDRPDSSSSGKSVIAYSEIEVDGVIDQVTNTAMIMSKFGSIQEFARQIQLFLSTSEEYSAFAESVFNRIERATEAKVAQKIESAEARNRRRSRGRGLLDDDDDDDDLVTAEDLRREKSMPVDGYDDGPTEGRDPITVKFSDLLAMFRRRAEMDESGIYFLCDLTDKVTIAAAIDDVDLPLETRYAFVRVPVDSSNAQVLQRFTDMVSDYASRGVVRLRDSVAHHPIPRTPTDLLEIENLHKIFDIYLWLANRFPSAFPDYEAAKEESKICAALVDTALRQMRTAGKRVSEPARVVGDDVGNAGDEESATDDYSGEQSRFSSSSTPSQQQQQKQPRPWSLKKEKKTTVLKGGGQRDDDCEVERQRESRSRSGRGRGFDERDSDGRDGRGKRHYESGVLKKAGSRR